MSPRSIRPQAPGRTIDVFSNEQNKDRLATVRQSGCNWCLLGERPDSNGLCEQCVFMFRRMLQSQKWQKLRIATLASEPYCRPCHTNGIIHIADTIDHINEWRYFPDLFWESSNHKPMNIRCHSIQTQLQQGFRRAENSE